MLYSSLLHLIEYRIMSVALKVRNINFPHNEPRNLELVDFVNGMIL